MVGHGEGEKTLTSKRKAYEVLYMMLASNNRPDSIVWEHEKSGKFSVRSAYRLFVFWG